MNPAVTWEYGGTIEKVKISKDGEKVCFSSAAGLNLVHTTERAAYKLPLSGKFLFNLSPDGNFVIVATPDAVIRMYSDTLNIVGEGKLPAPATSIYISTDSSKIAVLSGRTVYLLDQRLKLAWSQVLPVNGVKVKLDNAGYHLACVDAGNLVTLYDAAGKTCFARMFNSKITNLSLASASEYLVVSTLEDRVFLMDTKGNVLNDPRFGSRIKFAKISADGTRLIVCFPQEVHYYTRDFTPLQKFPTGHELHYYDASDNLGFVGGVSRTGEILAFHNDGLFWEGNLPGGAEGILVTPGGERAFVYSRTRIVKFDNLLPIQRGLETAVRRLEVLRGYGYGLEEIENLLKQTRSRFAAGDFGATLRFLDNIEKGIQMQRSRNKPQLSLLGVTNENFRANDWTKVLLYMLNTGNAHCADVRVEYSHNILMKIKPVPVLLTGELTKQVIGLKPLFSGIQKVIVKFRFWNFEGREFVEEVAFEMSSGSKAENYEKPVAVIKHGNWEAVFKKAQEPAVQVQNKCPNCKKNIMPEWVACPYCMWKLKRW
ncbi:MAG: zinc ribbon domain-containing protein [Thermoplasmata archaeon]|nr:zinc ribbon domain-containing protein [Thermoplasmata archaeon]